MKKLTFRYEMQLAFEHTVTEHHFQFRCLPYLNGIQHSYGERLWIEPAGSIREMTDGFGNRVIAGESMEAHESLNLQAEGTVFVDLTARRKEELHPLFLFPSDYTRPGGNVKRFFEEMRGKFQNSQKEDVREFSFACFLMHELYGWFSYVPGKTSVKTTAEEALTGGEGVCQDYAHIFIALCRMAGIPARYAAGMMVGEGATHAWAEVWTDGSWIGMDPTHDCLAGEEYIKLSHGRDFGDCPVDRGCFKGFTAQNQKIYVKVEDET